MHNIDKLDRQILAELMQDAEQPYTELAKKLFVSGGTVHVRMKKLRKMGLVKGATLTNDHALLGYDICAFLGRLSGQRVFVRRCGRGIEKNTRGGRGVLYHWALQHFL